MSTSESLNKKTIGSWIIHHSQKLQEVSLATADYEQISFAGKCGVILNALAGTDQTDIPNTRLQALSKASGVSTRAELPTVLDELERQRLIDKSSTGVSVLGLTSGQILEKTAQIFVESNPNNAEKAAIKLSEKASERPVEKKDAVEYVSDAYRIRSEEASDILDQCGEIGFFDSEVVSGSCIYFNGNLFRRNDIAKTQAVISSLSPEDERNMKELMIRLKTAGCISKDDAKKILGDTLYSKMCSIGFVDENSIGNEKGLFSFVTLPSTFTKFTGSAVDDAFDLAKAFVTSLTYGMTSSAYSRGRIRMIEALMRRLINGDWIGPATAIGQDYKVLEMKGVVKVRQTMGSRFSMKLLKKEVGQLALSVITEGEVSGSPLLEMPSVSATKYCGPESSRSIIRKRQPKQLKMGVAKLLSDLRTGGIQ